MERRWLDISDSKSLLSFADLETIDALESFVDQEVTRGLSPARSITFISKTSAKDAFEESEKTDFTISIESREEFDIVNLVRRIKRKQYEGGYRTIEGTFYLVPHEEDQIYTAITLDEKEFYTLGIRRLVKSLPTTITTSYLSTNEIYQLFTALDDFEGNLAITKAVVKSPSQKTEITYRDSDYYEVFAEIEDEDYYVDKIQFDLRNARQEFEGYVSREGGARFIAGDGNIYFKYLIKNIGSLISDKGELFRDKSREYGSREAEPIRIEYDEGAITGTSENQRLVDTLGGISNSSLAVYHDNPYVHASLLDFEDGSTVDVFLTSDREIAIVPGFRTSMRTLSRVCDSITSGFREGDVYEGSTEQEGNLAEYFG